MVTSQTPPSGPTPSTAWKVYLSNIAFTAKKKSRERKSRRNTRTEKIALSKHGAVRHLPNIVRNGVNKVLCQETKWPQEHHE